MTTLMFLDRVLSPPGAMLADVARPRSDDEAADDEDAWGGLSTAVEPRLDPPMPASTVVAVDLLSPLLSKRSAARFGRVLLQRRQNGSGWSSRQLRVDLALSRWWWWC